ncbi:MAG: DMT family transporter [Sphingobacterium sp.]|jgi:drug/metabolite transporter (DMT)-like permease|nr:DMT family transporter [Sphingobacterium sp.]
MATSSNFKGFVLAITAATLWGVSGTFGQFLFEQRAINVEWLISVRMLSAGVLFLLFSILKKENIGAIWVDKKDRIQLFTFSILGMLAVQYTYFAAVKHSNAATATYYNT